MSRILRRPMFRGGPVDSRGTGITSGLGYEAGGRVGYNKGELVTGGKLNPGIFGFKFDQPFLSLKTPEKRIGGVNLDFGQSPSDFAKALSEGSAYREYLKPEEEEFEKEVTSTGDVDWKYDEDGKRIPIEKEKLSLKDEIEKKRVEDITSKDPQGSLEEMGITVKEDGTTEFTGQAGGKQIKTGPTGNEPSNTEISAKDLIKENAELFKELLGEGQKEKIRKARIGDASDYLLKFFEGSQKEGATVGSAAADVAGFATSKDSKTEKAIAANEKVDQTATVLAINDYISGKRSKEDIEKALSLASASAQLKKGSLGEAFADFRARQGTLGTTDMEIIIKARFPDRPTEIIPAGAGEYQPSPDGSDEGKFYIEEDTKDVYEVVKGKKVKRF